MFEILLCVLFLPMGLFLLYQAAVIGRDMVRFLRALRHPTALATGRQRLAFVVGVLLGPVLLFACVYSGVVLIEAALWPPVIFRQGE